VSYLEIYNEVVNDLLRTQGTGLIVRDDKKKGVVIDGLKEEIVVSPEHVIHVINSGEAHRHVASTDYNLASSRSHTIFRMIIESNDLSDQNRKDVQVSALTLIDLAGSEKVVSTSAIRKREGAYINKSLLTLGTIISKLSERKKGEKIGHLPYRDSKLTRILEPSLSGNARICIVATVSSASNCFEETSNTLKFAVRAKKVTHKARVNQETDGQLSKYKDEINDLKQQLQVAEQTEQKLQDTEQELSKSQDSIVVDNKLEKNKSEELLENLRQELAEQESQRNNLEEKIKQLNKLILVSANIASTNTVETREMRRRSFSLKQINPEVAMALRKSTLMGNLAAMNRSSSIGNLVTSPERPPKSPNNVVTNGDNDASTLKKINEALKSKVDALVTQSELRNRMLADAKTQLSEMTTKMNEFLLEKLDGQTSWVEIYKNYLRDQYEREMTELRDQMTDKDIQIEMQKSDNSMLAERSIFVDNYQQPKQ